MITKTITIDIETQEVEETAQNDDIAIQVEIIAKQIRDGYTSGQFWSSKTIADED